jgi:hypothetical protein
MTNVGYQLTESQFDELMDYLSLLNKELKKCKKAKAYYAGCFVLGGILESMLLATIYCFPEEVNQAPSRLSKKDSGISESPLHWTLTDMLRISFEAEWFPFKGTDDPEQGELGDWLLNFVRELRNLIHPGKKVRDYGNVKISKKHFKVAREFIELATEELLEKIETDLMQAATKEERGK